MRKKLSFREKTEKFVGKSYFILTVIVISLLLSMASTFLLLTVLVLDLTNTVNLFDSSNLYVTLIILAFVSIGIGTYRVFIYLTK